jgi:hypothetical protein
MAGALCAALRALPAALRPHVRALERYALCALVDPRSPPRLRLAAAELLALLPRAAGAAPRRRARVRANPTLRAPALSLRLRLWPTGCRQPAPGHCAACSQSRRARLSRPLRAAVCLTWRQARCCV